MALCSSVSVRQQEGRARVLVQAAGWLREEADGGICACREDPGLAWVEEDVKDPQVMGQRVPLQHLHRHDEGVLEQVTAGGKRKVSSGSRAGGIHAPPQAVAFTPPSFILCTPVQLARAQNPEGCYALVNHAMANDDAAVI